MGVAELARIDEHAVAVDAPPQVVWDAALESLRRSFSAPAARGLVRVLGADPGGAAGLDAVGVGSTVPGFRVVEARPPELLVVAGRHRFSRYGIVFRVEPAAGGGSRLTAESRADFPGVHGRLYRLAVIGTRAHVVGVHRLLRGIRQTAERAS